MKFPNQRDQGPYALIVLSLLFICPVLAQTPGAARCTASAVPTTVRSEGLTEKVGDILLQCTGLTGGSPFTGNLSIFLPVAVTNRLNGGNTTTDVTVSANGTPLAVAGQVSGQTISFPALTFPVPASGSVDLRISNLRGAVAQLGAAATGPVQAGISFSLPVDRTQLTVGYPQHALLALVAGAGIPCTGSPLPSTPTFSSLIAAGTTVASTRVTEGFYGAFEARSPSVDTGTRVLLRFSGFPAAAQVFTPDFVAGSDAAMPTLAGDLGGSPSGGQFIAGSNTLLLARVAGADASGAGGYPLQVPAGVATLSFDTVAAVALTGGSGFVAYEVVSASPSTQQNAQIPVFASVSGGVAGTPGVSVVVAREQLSLAPVSATAAASVNAPVPRFEDCSDCFPPPDCTNNVDCPIQQPVLGVFPSPSTLKFTAPAGGSVAEAPGYIAVQNTGTGIMVWHASVQYGAGAATGWITLDPPGTTFVNNGSLRVFVNAKNLAAGSYQASVFIDASPDGTQAVPVTLVVSTAPNPNPNPNPNPTPQPKPVTVTSVVNAASMQPAPVVTGSLAVIGGTNLGGQKVAAAFDGIAAQIVSATAAEIRVIVPDLGSRTSANLVVTVDGAASAPQYVPVAAAWPAIFPNGLLNSDGSGNTADNPAPVGSQIQILATGLPLTAGQITIQIHDRKNLVPVSAGASNSPGVQQVSVLVPDDLPAMTTWVLVCGNVAAGQFCSPGQPLAIR